MEQILGIIIMIAIGWLLERGSERRKKRQNTPSRSVTPPQLPGAPKIVSTPAIPQPAPVKSFLTVDMPRDNYKPVEVPQSAPSLDPPVSLAPSVDDDSSDNSSIERWRRAIIDSEILARKF